MEDEEEVEVEVVAEGEKSKGVDVDFNVGGGDHGGVSSGGGKVARLPRWTRQEILVLIQGKRVAENRVRRGRSNCGGDSSINEGGGGGVVVQMEPKWATVSSYCKRHGVNRGPVQCRKRWSNLAGDYKKIKEWENQIKDEGESFWLMRNDFRRERKLPGFFDREVFDILNNNNNNNNSNNNNNNNNNTPSTTSNKDDHTSNNNNNGGGRDEDQHEVVFDSGRSATAHDGLFSDFEQPSQQQQQQQQGQQQQQMLESPITPIPIAIPAPTPISEKQYQPIIAEATDPGTNHEKQQQEESLNNPEMGSTSREGRKRRRISEEDNNNNNNNGDDDDNEGGPLQDQLVQVLENNGRLISSQLDAYNFNLKLDREERKDHATSLVAVLNKLADSLGRIADKL